MEHSHPPKRLLYLTMDDVKSVGFSDEDFINCVSDIFVQYGNGKAEMTAKTGTVISPHKNFQAASGWVAKTRTSGIKWSTGYEKNSLLGLNTNAGVIILSDTTCGLPKAIMDSYFISSRCTAASCAVFARHYARKDAAVIALLGASQQGLQNLRALLLVLNGLLSVKVYDRKAEDALLLARGIGEELPVSVFVCKTAEEALSDADIVLVSRQHVKQLCSLSSRWLPREGVFIAASGPDILQSRVVPKMDKVIVDGLAKNDVLNLTGVYAQQSEVSTGKKQGRENEREKILAVNNGLVIQEIYVASKMLEAAKEKGIGTELEPITW